MKIKVSDNRVGGCILVIVLAALLTLPWLERPFQSRGEPREALVAQSMVVNNNWVSPPAYNGAVPSKPPFNHWLISLTSLPSGEVTEFTARLPSALAIIIFSGAFYLFVARRASDDSALLASLILLSSFEWFRGAVTCRVDTLLSTSMAGALLSLFVWRERKHKGFPVLAAIFISCAALTKGPIGVALPLAIFSLFEFLSDEKSFRNILKIALRAVVTSLPVIVVVSLWYVAGYLQRGDIFLDKIYYENFQRLTSSMADEPHKHGAPYLLLMLALGLLPWTIVWVVALIREWSRSSLTVNAMRARWERASELQRFSFVAALFIFLFFCIPSSKRSVYIMPSYPFIALLAAESVSHWGERTGRLMLVLSKGLLWFIGAVVATLALGIIFQARPEMTRFYDSFVESLSWWRISALLVCFILLIFLPASLWNGSSAKRLATRFVAGVVILSFLVVEPIFNQQSPRAWIRTGGFRSAIDLSKHDKFYSFGSEAYAISFYLNKPFFSAEPGLPTGSIIFVEERNLDRLRSEIASRVREVSRFSSGLEARKKDVVVVEVLRDQDT